MRSDRNSTTFLVLMPKMEEWKISYEASARQQILRRVLYTRRILNSWKRREEGWRWEEQMAARSERSQKHYQVCHQNRQIAKAKIKQRKTRRTQQIFTKVLPIQLQQHNHHLEPIPSKQCSADKEGHDMGNHPYGGGSHPATLKERKCGVTLCKSTSEYYAFARSSRSKRPSLSLYKLNN
jgi:hypothetical protein